MTSEYHQQRTTIAAMLSDALTLAENIGDTLVAAHIAEALYCLQQRSGPEHDPID